jgi:hypothetical protein
MDALEPGGAVVEVRCAPESFEQTVATVGLQAARWGLEAAQRGAESAIGGGPRTAETVRQLLSACQGCFLAVLRGLRDEVPAADLPVPEELLASVRGAVRGGVPLPRLLRMMWTAHFTALDALVAATERVAPPAEAAAEARALTTESFAYVEAFSDAVERRYAVELADWTGSAAAERMRVVEEILADGSVDRGAAEAALGYALGGWHVAVLLTADRPAVRLDAELGRLAGVLDADATVSLHRSPTLLWGWLHRPGRPDAEPAERIRSAGPLAVGVRVAVGPAADGPAGFRWSHVAAQEAARLAGLGHGGVVGHADVAVAGLLTANAEHAGRFALDTLGSRLCTASPKARRLRETLAAYLEAGRSRAAAADRLHVSPGTVAYRVKQAEDLLGESVEGSGRTLMVALEIMRAFDAVGRDPATTTGGGPLGGEGL